MVITIGAAGIWWYSQHRKKQALLTDTFNRAEALKVKDVEPESTEQDKTKTQQITTPIKDVQTPSITEPLNPVMALEREKERLIKRARSFGITAPCEFELQSFEKAKDEESLRVATPALQHCRDVVYGGTAFCDDRQAALGEWFRVNR